MFKGIWRKPGRDRVKGKGVGVRKSIVRLAGRDGEPPLSHYFYTFGRGGIRGRDKKEGEKTNVPLMKKKDERMKEIIGVFL